MSAQKSMKELLADRNGPSKVSMATSATDVMNATLGVEEPSKEDAKPEPESKPEEKPAEKEGEKPESTEDDVARSKDKMVPLSELVKQREKNRALREELRAAKEAKTQDTGDYYQDAATPNAPAEGAVLKQYYEDRFTSSWLAKQDQLGEDKAGEYYTEFDRLCTEQEDSGNEGEARIWDTMYSQPDPGRFIVDYVNSYRDQSKYGATPKEWKSKIRAEVEAEIRGEMKQDLTSKTKLRDQLPRDVTGSRATSNDGEWTPPTSKELYGRRKFTGFKPK